MRNNNTVYDSACAQISKHLNPESKVLELACGTGMFTNRLSRKTSVWVATDFSEGMVKQASKNSKDENVTYKVEDATNLSFSADEFDVVLIANALHIIPNPNKALQEIHKVLKDDGLLIAPTFVYEKKIPIFRLWFLEKIGFKTYSKWTSKQLAQTVWNNGFTIISKNVITAQPLSECVVVAKK